MALNFGNGSAWVSHTSHYQYLAPSLYTTIRSVERVCRPHTPSKRRRHHHEKGITSATTKARRLFHLEKTSLEKSKEAQEAHSHTRQAPSSWFAKLLEKPSHTTQTRHGTESPGRIVVVDGVGVLVVDWRDQHKTSLWQTLQTWTVPVVIQRTRRFNSQQATTVESLHSLDWSVRTLVLILIVYKPQGVTTVESSSS